MSTNYLNLKSTSGLNLKLKSEFNPHSHQKEDNQLSIEIHGSWTKPSQQIILYPEQIKKLSQFLNNYLTGPNQQLSKTGGYYY